MCKNRKWNLAVVSIPGNKVRAPFECCLFLQQLDFTVCTALTICIDTLLHLCVILLTWCGAGSSEYWIHLRLLKPTKKFGDLGGLQAVVSLFSEGARDIIETSCKLVKLVVTAALERQLSEQLNHIENLLASGQHFGNYNFHFSTFLWFPNLSPIACQPVFVCRIVIKLASGLLFFLPFPYFVVVISLLYITLHYSTCVRFMVAGGDLFVMPPLWHPALVAVWTLS